MQFFTPIAMLMLLAGFLVWEVVKLKKEMSKLQEEIARLQAEIFYKR